MMTLHFRRMYKSTCCHRNHTELAHFPVSQVDSFTLYTVKPATVNSQLEELLTMLAPPFVSIIRLQEDSLHLFCALILYQMPYFASSLDLGGFVLPPQWRENGPWKPVSGKCHPQQERLLEDHGL